MIRRWASVVGAVAVLLGLAPVSASAVANDPFKICVYDALCNSYVSGTIVWHNRTATIQGEVVQVNMSSGHTTAEFDSYAGNNFIQGTTRTSSGGHKSFQFVIGDPDLVGGINRIVIQVCWHGSSATCSKPPREFLKNS